MISINAASSSTTPSGHAPPVFWPKEATSHLINLYKQNEIRFNSGMVRKKHIWREISEAIRSKGYEFTWEQCEGRWKTLTTAYRRAIVRNRVCQFYKELSEVLGYQPHFHPRPIAPKPNPSVTGQGGGICNGSALVVTAVSCSNVPTNSPAVTMCPMTNNVNPGSLNKKKRKMPQNEVMEWLIQFEERQERRAKEFMDQMERMHKEKIGVISELITVLKDFSK